jgi:hypothetical protein
MMKGQEHNFSVSLHSIRPKLTIYEVLQRWMLHCLWLLSSSLRLSLWELSSQCSPTNMIQLEENASSCSSLMVHQPSLLCWRELLNAQCLLVLFLHLLSILFYLTASVSNLIVMKGFDKFNSVKVSSESTSHPWRSAAHLKVLNKFERADNSLHSREVGLSVSGGAQGVKLTKFKCSEERCSITLIIGIH